MSSENLDVIGPITLEVKVHVAHNNSGAIGVASVGLAPGQVPTRATIHRAIGQALAAFPEGYRLLDAEEFFNAVLVKEKTGRIGNFAVPSSFQYDVSALEAAALEALGQAPSGVEDEDEDEDDGDNWLDDDED